MHPLRRTQLPLDFAAPTEVVGELSQRLRGNQGRGCLGASTEPAFLNVFLVVFTPDIPQVAVDLEAFFIRDVQVSCPNGQTLSTGVSAETLSF